MSARDLDPFWLSVWVASLATALIVVVGTPVAWLLARTEFVGKNLVMGVLTLPLVLPPTVLGYGLLLVLGRRGWVGSWLEQTLGVIVVFHPSGAVIAAAVLALPMFVIPARAAFAGVHPELEDAARLLGRGEFSVFLSITVPLSWRGYVSGVVLAFARALGEFGATLMLAGNIPGRTRTASLALYDSVLGNEPRRAALNCGLLVVTSLVAVGLAQRAQRLHLAR